jgi:hypothetical protein
MGSPSQATVSKQDGPALKNLNFATFCPVRPVEFIHVGQLVRFASFRTSDEDYQPKPCSFYSLPDECALFFSPASLLHGRCARSSRPGKTGCLADAGLLPVASLCQICVTFYDLADTVCLLHILILITYLSSNTAICNPILMVRHGRGED